MIKKYFAVILSVVMVISLCACSSSKNEKNVTGSTLPILVPDVIGLSEYDATTKLSDVGFVPEVVYASSTEVEKGTVIKTSPEKASKINSGSTVKVYVSKGEKRECSVSIPISFTGFKGEVSLKVYVDGKLDSSKSGTVNTEQTLQKTFEFKGTGGKKTVKFKINNKDYQSYEINFDNRTYVLL